MPPTRTPETEETFGDIGEFVVAFEHAMGSLGRVVMFALTDRFRLSDQRVARMLLAGMGTRQMIRQARAILHFLYTDNTQAQDFVNTLCSRAESLNKRRNDVIHSLWFIGYGSGGEIDPGRGVSDRLRKDGVALDQIEAERLPELIDECWALDSDFGKLLALISYGWDPPENF